MAGIFERLRETATRFPEGISLQIKEESGLRSFTFKDVYDKAEAMGCYLLTIGMVKGDRVAIFAENTPEWCIAYLGIVSIGAVAVPLDALYTKEELDNLLKDSGSKVIFTSKGLISNVQKASNRLKINIIRLDEPLPENLTKPTCRIFDIHSSDENFKTRPHPPTPHSRWEGGDFHSKGGREGVVASDIASLLYTSGTTGVPKGVMLTHGNLLSNADALISTGIVTHNDHVLCMLPLHHTYPFMVCFLVPMLVGGTTTFLNSLKGPDIVKTVRDEMVTVLVGVPQLFSMMRKGILGRIDSLSWLKRSLTKLLFVISREARRRIGLNPGKVVFRKLHSEFGKRLRFFACGGARLDPSIAFDMEGLGFTVIEGYGLTETSPVVTFNMPGRKKIGSVGRALEQVEVKVENPDQAGVGEVLIKGPNVMKGYYKNPEATAKVIKEGWFHSGDLGSIDSEGYLFITGRSKEVIVLGSGKNIYPEDMESHYLNSPYIKEICVIGIPDTAHPGSFEGIKALVFPNHERLAEDGIANISEQIRWQIERISASLPTYKRVMGFSILKEPLPRTHLGKIRRFMVKEAEPVAAPGEKPVSDEDRRLLSTDMANVVLHLLSSITDRKISINSNLELDLGIDSLGRVELMVSLENSLGVVLPQTFPSETATVKDVILKAIEYTSGVSGVEALKGPISWRDILRHPPSDDMMERISLRRGIIGNASLRLVTWLIYIFSRILLRLEVRGLENVPSDRGCIIAPNHVSFIDGFVIGSALGKRLPKLYAVGFRGFFHGFFTSRLAKWGHVISIDADSGLSESLQASAYVLRGGVTLIVFPEGGRSVDGRIMPFKKGIGILAKELDIPLVPTYIKGSLDVLPRGAWIPRLKKVTVTFGEPLTPDEIKELDYQGIADRLRERVVSIASGTPPSL